MGRYIIVSANKSTPTAVAECLAGRLIVQFVSYNLRKFMLSVYRRSVTSLHE